MLGWILAGISRDEKLSESWLFKGGTCLRKCFFEDYRYSEDLDFTAVGKETVNADVIQKSMERLSDLIFKQTGIEINAKKPIIDVLNNNSYQEIIQIRIYYCGHSRAC